MATPLPIIRGSSTALYPFRQTYHCLTGISDGQAATPARWVRGYPLVSFEFPYDPITQTQKDALRAALTSAKGQFATDRSATTDVEYDYLSFDADEFSATEKTSTQYGVRWSLTQTLPQNWSPGASGGAFPVLGTGALCQLPYTQKRRFQTIVSRMPSGPKYVWAEFAGGLTGFPGALGLMTWEFANSNLSDTEASALIAHFLANWGDCFPFTFTDEDTTTYPNVYYASPDLTIMRTGPNHNAVKVALIQMN